MKQQSFKPEHFIAYCGLYCANCSRFKKKKCPGCAKNEKASWCKIRTCCISKRILTCASCDEYKNVINCSKYSNVFATMIEFVTRTDRSRCIEMIKNEGEERFDAHMRIEGKMSLPKKKRKG
jgi:hypothetical protein